MKKIVMMLTALLTISLSACSQNKKTENKEMKVLVTYFSASGVTKAAARQLAEVAGADLKTAYPALNWKEGKLLNRISKKELETWTNGFY